MFSKQPFCVAAGRFIYCFNCRRDFRGGRRPLSLPALESCP